MYLAKVMINSVIKICRNIQILLKIKILFKQVILNQKSCIHLVIPRRVLVSYSRMKVAAQVFQWVYLVVTLFLLVISVDLIYQKNQYKWKVLQRLVQNRCTNLQKVLKIYQIIFKYGLDTVLEVLVVKHQVPYQCLRQVTKKLITGHLM